MGHTHNQLDGTFGVWSRNVYGSNRGGTTGRDVLSFTGLKKVAGEVFGDRLTHWVDLRAVQDWGKFVRPFRHKDADNDIKVQFSVQMKATDADKILVRSKSAVSAEVPFSEWHQMLPHPENPPNRVLPAPGTAPPMAPPKEWSEFEQTKPQLRAFYSQEYEHPVHIPAAAQREMLSFLETGPSPHAPPAWIKWDREGVAPPLWSRW